MILNAQCRKNAADQRCLACKTQRLIASPTWLLDRLQLNLEIPSVSTQVFSEASLAIPNDRPSVVSDPSITTHRQPLSKIYPFRNGLNERMSMKKWRVSTGHVTKIHRNQLYSGLTLRYYIQLPADDLSLCVISPFSMRSGISTASQGPNFEEREIWSVTYWKTTCENSVKDSRSRT